MAFISLSFLGRATLNAFAYHFGVLLLPLEFNSRASRFLSRVYPEIAPKHTSAHPHQQPGRTDHQDGYWDEYE